MKRRILPRFLVILVLLASTACSHIYTAKGMYYRVKKGDTLESISSRYKKDVQEVAEVNNIEKDAELQEGRAIYIPGVAPDNFFTFLKRHTSDQKSKKVAEKKEKSSDKKEKKKEEKNKKQDEEDSKVAQKEGEGEEEEETKKGSSKIQLERGRFIWPIDGEVSSLFGMRRKRRHDGIDIRSKIGTPVRAAASGEVVYAKRMRGYGNLVLVKHDGDFFTVYAHNSVNLVKEGAKVKKGQLIAKVGRTGRATGPHLHFEVRQGPKARNPLFFLPKNEYAQKAKERSHDDGGDEGEGEDENP